MGRKGPENVGVGKAGEKVRLASMEGGEVRGTDLGNVASLPDGDAQQSEWMQMYSKSEWCGSGCILTYNSPCYYTTGLAFPRAYIYLYPDIK